MTAPKRLVPRHNFAGDSVAVYVADSDAAKLENVVEAAKEMRASIRDVQSEMDPTIRNGIRIDDIHRMKAAMLALDAALAEVEGREGL